MKLHLDVKLLSRQATKVRLAKFTVLALVFIFAAFAAPLSAWGAERTQFRFKGLVASHVLTVSKECIATSVGVRATRGTERVGPGKPGKGSEVEDLSSNSISARM